MIDAIELQVIVGALRAACEEMGAVLIRAAHSANIKERRDASTALFDAHGEMTMQAEHIPVHLGAMPAAVAAVLHEDHSEGRPWILNDPFQGGTHLPDITVITPILAGSDLLGFAASRAHHADVGGRIPGSMPADSRTLAEEGTVIPPRPVSEEAIAEIVSSMRQPAERRADLRAQLAANRVGAARLTELALRVEAKRLKEATDAVLDYAERRTRACLAAMPDGSYTAQDVLEAAEADLPIKLRATIEGERLTLDFSGSAPQQQGNLNCPLAVTRSACYFAVRVLTDPDIPSCAGAYRPIEVRAPQGSVLNANPGAAVVAGNVETSSRVADVVLEAFGRAVGQGTMNNMTLGDEQFSYYETLGGGQGACPDADGPSAVHVAMSNTLNTPIEALEREFPLRVVQYAIRRDSGGKGRWHGGDGVIRELEALREMELSLITERRRHGAPGAAGGAAGKPGRNTLDGHELPAKHIGRLHESARLRIETPGGGGFGDGNE
ncbi:MAG TPA: hydantoinase B/oxoprolinase family protein [Solirubrobacteraceae bacterium]|jgi:N-methylhydantoinase B|nr:hydantoinase B/oxoprolinase family protein [Solirubrobacteraceae bacterium]